MLALRADLELPDRRVFKLKGLGGPTLVRRDLADRLDAQRFTGFEWLELDDFES